jgi:peroxiredoxin
MRRSSLVSPSGLLVVVVLAVVGCGQSPTSTPDRSATEPPTRPSVREPKDKQKQYDVKQASAERKLPRLSADDEPGKLPPDEPSLPLDDVATEDLTMPKVLMSEAHEQMCRVRAGDAFPALELPDLNARQQSVAQLSGKKLTVVFFWNARQATALEELADLGPQIERRFGQQGVAVVGVNTGDSPQLASELVKQAKAQFVNLLDESGKGFSQVGNGKIPRTYLVDASGTIVWFDIEYSRTTRRELSQAIRFLLAQQ